ncbi:uncharacterized protein LOC144110188 [Amblyomma americanum]|uniref:Uncharacterized protein n=1 Tax=Amblyomma americanum TaxID=6943 RepID=A0AAQ4F7C7_AMBAM
MKVIFKVCCDPSKGATTSRPRSTSTSTALPPAVPSSVPRDDLLPSDRRRPWPSGAGSNATRPALPPGKASGTVAPTDGRTGTAAGRGPGDTPAPALARVPATTAAQQLGRPSRRRMCLWPTGSSLPRRPPRTETNRQTRQGLRMRSW